MPPTMKNKELIQIYESYVDTLYYQRLEANIVGSFESKDHPENVKRGAVCVYFKEHLSVRCLPNAYFKEFLTLEVSINNKRGYLVSLYRSPS